MTFSAMKIDCKSLQTFLCCNLNSHLLTRQNVLGGVSVVPACGFSVQFSGPGVPLDFYIQIFKESQHRKRT